MLREFLGAGSSHFSVSGFLVDARALCVARVSVATDVGADGDKAHVGIRDNPNRLAFLALRLYGVRVRRCIHNRRARRQSADGVQ